MLGDTFSTDAETMVSSMQPTCTQSWESPVPKVNLRTNRDSPSSPSERLEQEDDSRRVCLRTTNPRSNNVSIKILEDPIPNVPYTAIRPSIQHIIMHRAHDKAGGRDTHTSSNTNKVSPQSSPKSSPQDPFERLYNCSKPNQADGKERRRAIFQKYLEIDTIPCPDNKKGLGCPRVRYLKLRRNERLEAFAPLLHSTFDQNDTLPHLHECMHMNSNICFKGSQDVFASSAKNGVSGNKSPQSRGRDMDGRSIVFPEARHSHLHKNKKRLPSVSKTTSREFGLWHQYISTKHDISYGKAIKDIVISPSANKMSWKKISRSKAGDEYAKGLKYLEARELKFQTNREGFPYVSSRIPPIISVLKVASSSDRNIKLVKRQCGSDELKALPRLPSSNASCNEEMYLKKDSGHPEQRDEGIRTMNTSCGDEQMNTLGNSSTLHQKSGGDLGSYSVEDTIVADLSPQSRGIPTIFDYDRLCGCVHW